MRNSKEYKEINQQFYENCWSIGRNIIKQGMDEGVFNVENIEQAAISIRCMIDGSLIQWLMRDHDDLHSYYRTVCYESILKFLKN